MLSLIIGPAGSGKSYELEQLMQQRARDGKRSVLIVAEQFTSSVELFMQRRLGDRLSHFVTVADFGRIARMTTDSYGGAMPTVGDAYRVALCRRAVLSLTGQLKYYNADSYKIGFYSLCADIIKELKMCCSPKQLAEVATGDKLRDIALIYESYNSLLSGRREPQDTLLAAAQCIAQHDDFLQDSAIFIDGFDGFTAPEYEIIKSLLANDRQVVCTLCAPTESMNEDLFDTVRLTATRLKRLASQAGSQITPTKTLYKNHRNTADIELINMLFCGEDAELCEPMKDVTITPYKNLAEEAFNLAAAIHAEVRSGREYNEIAIVMRKPEDYYSELTKSLALFNVPVYLDLEGELRFCAPATLVGALLSLYGGVNSEDILTLIATGLCTFLPLQTAALQDWILRYNPTAKEWREGVEISAEDIATGKSWCMGEAVRAELMTKLEPIISKEKPPVIAVYDAMQLLCVGDNIQGDEQLRRYNLVVDILEQLYTLDADGTLKVDEVIHLYTILLQNTKLHSLPRVVDCVTVYSPDRIIGAGIKSLYILGANSEVFPSEVGHSGLLDHNDRERLAEQELMLPGLYANRVMLEELYLYKAVTTPSEKLHISYITENGAKLSTQLTAFEGYTSRLFIGRRDLVATPAAAAVVMAQRLFLDEELANELNQAISQNGDERLVAAITSAQQLPCFDLKEEKVIKNLIKTLSLSSARVSTYRKCAFSFFMQYLLKVEPIRRLELSADIAGTLIHHIMERLMSEYPELSCLSDDKLYELCKRYTAECVDKLFGDRMSVKERFIVGRLEKSAAQLLLFLRAEQRDSIFRPQRLEQDLSHNITTDDGINITLRGKVDRIDACTIDDERYIRVVDYKTGSKTFSLKDVETGLDIQLFLYLFYAAEQGEIPAGTFYLHNQPKDEGDKLSYRYDGAALRENDVLNALCLKHIGIRTDSNGGIASRQENRLYDRQKAQRIRRHIDSLLCDIAGEMSEGAFDALPAKMTTLPCDYCGYRIICRKTDGDGREKTLSASSQPFE